MHFLQALVNEAVLRSELESLKVTFQNEVDTKASETDLQTLKVSNEINLVLYFMCKNEKYFCEDFRNAF